MISIKDNLELIREKIIAAEKKAGRPENSVKLMAVSKFHPQSDVVTAIECNQFLFGENRVQEAVEKFEPIIQENSSIELHMIGHLQKNKVKSIVKAAQCIQSVDSLELVQEIEKQCAKINKNINILFELHTAEDSKSGFASASEIDEVLKLMTENQFPHVIPKGFMTMAPFVSDENLIRKSFRELRETKEMLLNKYPQFDLSELSMGMSGDFEIAIEEGSTLVRVGTAIFGERNY